MAKQYTTITKMWADMGYQSEHLKEYMNQKHNIALEIVKRPSRRFWVHKDTPQESWPKVEAGFKVLPRRWVVERTFAWLNRNRRLSKEYDFLTATTESFIYTAMCRILLRRIYA